MPETFIPSLKEIFSVLLEVFNHTDAKIEALERSRYISLLQHTTAKLKVFRDLSDAERIARSFTSPRNSNSFDAAIAAIALAQANCSGTVNLQEAENLARKAFYVLKEFDRSGATRGH
jgi:hypothetical protein